LIKSHRLRLLAAAAPAVLAAGAVFASASSAFAATPTAKPDSQALFTIEGGVTPQFLANARTIPHFTFNYTDPSNGVTYPITMVGADPRSNSSTTVHTVIIPLKMNFVAANQNTSALNDLGWVGFRATPLSHTFDPTVKVNGLSSVDKTLSSPVFANATLPADMGGDSGQLGDTFMRSQFNKLTTGYHVYLQNDAVLPVQTMDVPGNQGLAYVRPVPAWRVANGRQTVPDVTGVADVSWFSAQLQNLMKSLQIDPTTVPIFVTDNVLLYIGEGNYLNCCILGYHGSGAEMPNSRGTGSINGQGANKVQTYMYAAYTTPGTYSGFLPDYLDPNRTTPNPTRGLADIHALSHEVSEWLDDPFTNNAVQPWLTPTAPQYGCTRLLEVGDPVVGVWFPLAGNPDVTAYNQWHPEDEVFAQWFGRGGVETKLGAALPNTDGTKRLTFMGLRTTVDIGGPYAGFADYAKGC
jgi:hypothetical protein